MKNWKRMTGLVLALICMLSLAACGQQGETPAAQAGNTAAETSEARAQEAEYAYTASFRPVELADTGITGLSISFYTDEAIYALGSELAGKRIPDGETEQYPGQYDYYRQNLVKIGYDGKLEKLGYTPLAVEKEHEGKYAYMSDTYSQSMQMMPDGSIAEIAVFYENWTGTEGLSRSDDAFWENYEYGQEYYFRILNPDGTEKLKVLLPMDRDAYVSATALDGDGNFIYSAGTNLFCISPEGESLWNIDIGEYVEQLALLRDGRLCVLYWGDGGMACRRVDTEKRELGEAKILPSDAWNISAGNGTWPLCYSSGSTFSALDPDTGEKEKLFSWLNTDVSAEMYSKVYVAEDGTVFGLLDNSRYTGTAVEPDYQVFQVRYAQVDPAAKKQSITLATQWLHPDVSREILRFNLKNDRVHIDVLDYSQYNTEEDYNAGLTKLQTEMMAGTMPDLVDLRSLPAGRLEAKGILEDLYPFLDADGELSRDDFFPNVLQAVEQNGKLVSTVPGFTIMSLIGASAVVGEEPGWTYEEFDAALASLPDGARPLSAYTTRSDILRSCFGLDMDSFVNWSTGECNFYSDKFSSLLKFAKRFPAEFDWNLYNYETDSDMAGLASGQQMLAYAGISSVEDVMYNQTYFGGQPYTYIGYPTSTGTGNYFSVDSGLGMTTACRDKEAAWQFLRTFFTEKFQSSLYSVPIRISTYEAKLAEAMTVRYRTDADGQYVLDEAGNRIPEARMTLGEGPDHMELYAMSQEDADKLTELIRTTTRTLQTDESILAIVQEQAEAFFQGQKSADEVARLTQSKVNIYVNEQR